MKAERIICYVNYNHKGISLYKISDFDNKSYITIDEKALIRMIESERNESDMDLEVLIQYYYGKFTDEELEYILKRIKDIIRTNNEYKEYRNVKEINLKIILKLNNWRDMFQKKLKNNSSHAPVQNDICSYFFIFDN